MQLQWSDSYSVGVPSLDDQHKKLVQATNVLFQAIMEERSDEVARSILDELVEYVAEHFSYEEELLAKHGFSPTELELHIHHHQQLTSEVKDFVKRIDTGESTLDLKLYQFLREWVEDHLNGSDQRYAAFLQSKGVK